MLGSFRFASHSWLGFVTVTLLALLVLDSGLSSVNAANSSPEIIKGTDATGKTSILLVDRAPALYTGDFGDCMGGQSLINLTSFDAAYYADNMTVLFNIAGSTNLKNESVMLYISVQAYGEDRFNLVFNPCSANFASLCPLTNNIPVRGQALIPVSRADVADVPSLALNIPDFEGSAILRIFSNSSQGQIGCFSAVMKNGSSISHPGLIGSFLVLFTILGILASFTTATWGTELIEIRSHYAHSLSVLVIFEVFHSIFFSGALSLNWPSILIAWWSNFAWFSGMIHNPSVIRSINRLVGISGNSSQVGGAGSTVLTNKGGLQQQIYGRSMEMKIEHLPTRLSNVASLVHKRATSNEDNGKMYDWAGLPVFPGLPLPGNWSTFAGELSMVGIPAADAFLNGIIWLLVFTLTISMALITLKLALEIIYYKRWIKEDHLTNYRSNWLGFLGQVLLRITFISFFMIMTLTLYQFSYGGKPQVIAITVIVFLATFGGFLAATFYSYFFWIDFCHTREKLERSSTQLPMITKFPFSHFAASKSENPKENHRSQRSSCGFQDKEGEKAIVESETQNLHHNVEFIKRFGFLTARFRHNRWWFFMVWTIYQFVRACLIGGARVHPTTQVIALLIWELISFVAMIIIDPWESVRNTVLAVHMLGISKIITTGLSIAFLPQLQLSRILTTIIGIIIIIIQGLLVIGLLILIILGAISTHMSLSRGCNQFKPENLNNIRLKYFTHIEQKSKDLNEKNPSKMTMVLQEPIEPSFSVNQVRREPKIEDETPIPIFHNLTISNIPQLHRDVTYRPLSRVNSVSESIQSQVSKISNNTYTQKRLDHRSWSCDLKENQPSQSSRSGTSIDSVLNYNNSTAVPLIRSSTSISYLKPVIPSLEQQMQFANQRVHRSK